MLIENKQHFRRFKKNSRYLTVMTHAYKIMSPIKLPLICYLREVNVYKLN